MTCSGYQAPNVWIIHISPNELSVYTTRTLTRELIDKLMRPGSRTQQKQPVFQPLTYFSSTRRFSDVFRGYRNVTLDLNRLTIFTERSILDIWHGSKYASDVVLFFINNFERITEAGLRRCSVKNVLLKILQYSQQKHLYRSS